MRGPKRRRRPALLPHQTLSLPPMPLNPRKRLRSHADGTWSYKDPETDKYVGPFASNEAASDAFHEKWPLICPLRRPKEA